jgi:hypothetical protein
MSSFNRNIRAAGSRGRRRGLSAALALAVLLIIAPAAHAGEFGIKPGTLETSFQNSEGVSVIPQASSHPYSYRIAFKLNVDGSGTTIGGELRDFLIDLPTGMAGAPFAVPRCTRQDFEGFTPQCPPDTQVGLVKVSVSGLGVVSGPIYNLVPPPGVAVQLGFSAANLNALQNVSVLTGEGYRVRSTTNGLPLEITTLDATIWGVPANSSHDGQRGSVAAAGRGGSVASTAPELPFLTVPAQCSEPLVTRVSVDSTLDPGNFDVSEAAALDPGGHPVPPLACGAVPFAPQVAATPTSRAASAASGLDFELKLPNEGLLNPGGIAETEPHKIEVALPEGITANPSAAEGLATCSEAQFGAERIDSAPGAGCPEASKLGSIVAHSPLIDEPIEGALYLATPYQNPEGTLIAIYLVFRAPERGVLIKQSGKVVPDPSTGRLVTTLEDLPPLPYSDATLHFREGARGVLVTPDTCGTYTTTAKLYPFSAPNTPVTKTASFQIERGVNGGACPSGGAPFYAGFEAGSENNQAAAYSPFYLRLTREDGDQDLTRFSSKLPPGVVGRLAGTAQCSEAAIAQARSRTGQNGGHEELASPSCPATSEIGRTIAGAGVGGVLTYVPGKVYLAGPYNGAPLSVVAITPGVAGPFDVGTIVVRQALRINPLTVEVEADGSSSDPIPHILKGIPLKVRDIRVYVNKPDFTLNPTSCEESATEATLWSGAQNVFSSADDVAHSLAARFQAASCASLGFKPRLGLKLKGGTRRGGHPALRGTFTPRAGDANAKRLVLRLPGSAFLDQAHIRTICTRVQFAANGGNGGGCPAGAIYGKATAWSPLVEEPLSGPVFLRSSNHNLPDFVAALHGIVDVEASARIDSVHGGIRATFTQIPDAPLSRVVVEMQGGNKGLIVNSTNLCAGVHRANAQFEGHNGRREELKPVLGAGCKSGKGKRRG